VKRKVSAFEKKEIVDSFLKGTKIKDIALKNNFSVPTISRQLKNILGQEKFDQIKKGESNIHNSKNISKIEGQGQFELNVKKDIESEFNLSKSNIGDSDNFFEIIPIDQECNFEEQKEISSQSLSKVDLPAVVYLIVDKDIELVHNILNDYPEWSFLPQDDLQRKTIQIFSDHKNAKKQCLGNKKVIKVPNSNVFQIASNFLLKKGISRIIYDDMLISIP
tara:strand:- start:649 stop:1308 length:660 start_codon:yes stop_codon:yes gene_type:complete